MITIKDVAKKAGVSISTASYALNNDSRVKKETKERIIKIAEELNYIPSGTARNLKKKKNKTIGVCVTEFGGPVWTELLEGIHTEILEQGYNLIVTSGKSAERMLLDRQTDAVIVNDSSLPDDLIRRVSNENFPIVVLGRHVNHPHVYEMMIENEASAYTMTKFLLDKGYQSIGYLSGVEDAYDNLYRFKGFVKALSEINKDIPFYYKGDFTKQSGYNTIKQIINENKVMPEALFCANDEMAIGAMDALKKSGYHIPKDIAVVGFDDIELSRYYTPPLTTIKIDRIQFGKDVAKHILKICSMSLEERKTFEEDFYYSEIKGELIKRKSA